MSKIVVALGGNALGKDPKEQLSLLKDVAKIDIGADSYNIQSEFNNSPAVVIGVSQTPNTNSLQVMKNLKVEMEKLHKSFRKGSYIDLVLV